MHYRWQITPEIEALLTEIEISRRVFTALPTHPQRERHLLRCSILKSSLFSAKIEGNPLTEEDLRTGRGSRKHTLEIQNLATTYEWLVQHDHVADEALILSLHARTMKGLSPDVGKFRAEMVAIYNQAGIVIHLAPPPQEIEERLHELLVFASDTNIHPLIRTSVTHFGFEKIHPFMDGNGRVGRLLAAALMQQNGYGFRGLLGLEEVFEQQREQYYQALSVSDFDATEMVFFWLTAILKQVDQAITLTQKEEIHTSPEDCLLPRRKEILLIIRDHQQVSFDFIRRRFMGVPDSTLHNDFRSLVKLRLVRKMGSTRGVVYTTSDVR